MTNPEARPAEVECAPASCAESIEVLTPRDVPLGGPRAMTVRRTLPQRLRSLIGPWCFIDHFGPDDVAATGGMQVPRHPHTGLATVTLLVEGNIEHIDSTGFANVVRPGEVNLMIAGRGISHSEFSADGTRTLHGVQLWYALPDALRHGMPQSQHFVAEPVGVPGGTVLTYLGSFAGRAAPIDTRVPALAAEVRIDAGAELALDLDPEYEHGLLLDSGTLELSAADAVRQLGRDELGYLPAGPSRLLLRAGDAPARAILIGGRPFGERIVMWWNFIGRSHEEIVAYRRAWQSEIGKDDAGAGAATGSGGDDGKAPPAQGSGAAAGGEDAGGVSAVEDAGSGRRFGTFPPGTPAPLPAPVLPEVRLRPRD